jgi:hypothetical protein
MNADVLIGEATLDVQPLEDCMVGSSCVLKVELTNDGVAAGTARLEFGVQNAGMAVGGGGHSNAAAAGATVARPSVSPQLLEHNRELRTKIADLEDRIAEYKRRESQMHQSADQARKQLDSALHQRNTANARATESEAREMAVQRQASENAKNVEAVRRERLTMQEHEEKLRAELASLQEKCAENKVELGQSKNKVAELQKELTRAQKSGSGKFGTGTTDDLILQGEWAAERIELLKRLRDAEQGVMTAPAAAGPVKGVPAGDAEGVVWLQSIECSDIKNVEWMGDNDPYCEVNIGNEWAFTTTCYKDGGSDVVWRYDEESEGVSLKCSRQILHRQTLRVVLKDKNEFRKDTVIGEGVLELDQFAHAPSMQPFIATMALLGASDKMPCCTVKVVLRYQQTSVDPTDPDNESVPEGGAVVATELVDDSERVAQLLAQITQLDIQIVKLSGDRSDLLAFKVSAEARIKELRKKLRVATAEHKKKKNNSENGGEENSGEAVFSLEWGGRDVPSLLRERFGHCANLLDAARDNLALRLKSAHAMDEESFGATVKALLSSKATSDTMLSVPYSVSIQCRWGLDSKLVVKNAGAAQDALGPKKVTGTKQEGKYKSWTDTNGSSLNWGDGFLFGSTGRGLEPTATAAKYPATTKSATKRGRAL